MNRCAYCRTIGPVIDCPDCKRLEVKTLYRATLVSRVNPAWASIYTMAESDCERAFHASPMTVSGDLRRFVSFKLTRISQEPRA